MSKFKEILPNQLEGNPFIKIGNEWMVVTAEKDGKVNAMTASWGGLGIMWGKNVAFVVLRPQRYTRELIEGSDTFSLSFYDESYKKTLGYLGKVSGRDEDKVAGSGLTVAHQDNIPYFEEASTVLLCKKLFVQQFEESNFIEKNLINQMYPDKDYHYLYIVEICKVLKRD